MLSLAPYLPPITREPARCVCGGSGRTAEETLCRPCRETAVAEHGDRLTRLLGGITYDHRSVHLKWSATGTTPEAFNPRVTFTAPDATDPDRALVEFHGFAYWADDMLVAACAAGASDDQVLALAVAQAHYVISCLAVHEVGEWFTYRDEQVFPPHRPDPYLPHDEDSGPDGNGQVVLWLTYGRAVRGGRPAGAVPSPLSAECWPDLADLGTLPGQTLSVDQHGITIEGPGDAPAAFTAWADAAPDMPSDGLEQVLRPIHQAIVASELAVVARHLRLLGEPVLAPAPGPAGDGVAWQAYLTHDG